MPRSTRQAISSKTSAATPFVETVYDSLGETKSSARPDGHDHSRERSPTNDRVAARVATTERKEPLSCEICPESIYKIASKLERRSLYQRARAITDNL